MRRQFWSGEMGMMFVKRMVLLVPTFLCITLISFVIMRLVPGDPAAISLSAIQGQVDASEYVAALEKVREGFGLDENLFVQYVRWLARFVTLDFGVSFRTGEPVRRAILSALPVTVVLNVAALLIMYTLALPAGIWAAVRPGGFIDKASSLFFMLAYSIPNFWIAIILMVLLGSADYLNVFPISGISSPDVVLLPWYGRVLNVMWHLALPAFCLSISGCAFLSRFTRSTLADVMTADYVKYAFAKGCGPWRVLWRHVFRSAALPFVTLAGQTLPAIIGGSVIIEKIFSIQGMGMLMFDSVLSRDYPMAMGITAIGAVLVLVSLLLSDVLYLVVDPRMRGR